MSLLGRNPKNLIFLSHENSKISPTGELLDRWGNPYFFHSVSSREIEVRSAGPDHKMWTEDDVTNTE